MPLIGMLGKSKKSKDGGSAERLANGTDALYALKGGNTQEFWKYTLPVDTGVGVWSELDTIKALGSTGKKKKVKGGGDLTVHLVRGSVFALKGNKTNELWEYTPFGGLALAPRADRSGVMAKQVVSTGYGAALAPNPLADGYATLRYSLPRSGPATLYVYDATGSAVVTKSILAGRSGSTSLDLRNLSAGVYLVKLSTEGYTATHKLVVQK